MIEVYGLSGQEEKLAIETIQHDGWFEESDHEQVEKEELLAQADEYFLREENI